MLEYCYLNGKIISVKEAHVAINDLALLRGYAIFDYFRTYNGKPFLIDAYLDRFYNSAKNMLLPIVESQQQIKEIISDLLNKNQVKDAAFRFVLTGGISNNSYNPGIPTFYILAEQNVEYPHEYYENGIHLMMHEHLRMFPEIKTTNYLTGVKLETERLKKNAIEILYCYQGNLLECVRNNFFLVKNDCIITPAKNVLIGRTRNLVIALARKKFNIEERDIKVSEIEQATEAFITGTTKKIMPVRSLDEHVIGNGKVGQVTKTLIQCFHDFVKTC